MSNISNEKINRLKTQISGRVIVREDSDYHEERAIWNSMIDKKPALIVQCASSPDVFPALSFAKENHLEISIRGAGHNIAGSSMNDDGVVIDFSKMNNVRVDSKKKRAYVEPGATLGDLDKATQAHGLATPVGINSTTGVAGLTLGGGFGWLSRKYGMTIDNLVSVNIIMVDGKELIADAENNQDLFWAIRGGGGNFGIVTQFEFALHPVGPEILAGLIVYPLSQAKQVLTKYRKFTASAPEELSVWSILRQAPPLPFLPEKVHGTEVLILSFCYSGDIKKGETLVRPLQSFGDPHAVHIAAQPYAEWQTAFDPLLTPGARNYWKTHNLISLSDSALDEMIKYAAKLPSGQCEIFIAHIKGAVNRVSSDDMAYGHRDVEYILNVHGRWDSPDDDETCISWAREFFNAAAPFASAGAYVNFMTQEEGGRVAAAYGSNYDRLRKMKLKYDPENLLHTNQNIKP
jgi:FAD/FMN-containing dehydrogenase